MAIPLLASKLVPWAQTFVDTLTANPGDFFLDPADLVPLQTKTTTFLLAQAAVSNPASRSGALIQARDAAQNDYYALARLMYNTIQSNTQITNENKVTAGVKLKDTTPTPVPVPSTTPKIDVVSVTGRVVRLRIYDSSTPKKTKAADARGANVWSYVGETPPTDINLWQLRGQPTRTSFEVEFSSDVPPGTKVWFTAAWYNPRGELGMLVAPVSTYTQFGGLDAASGEESQNVKIAA